MNKLKEKIESVGLIFKNQIIISGAIGLFGIGLGVALFFLTNNIICLAFCIAASMLLIYMFLTRYKSLQAKQESDMNYEFISLLSFFKTYISNGYSVYQSFKELTQFSSLKLQERLNFFLERIDEDKSVAPFVELGLKFNNSKIEQLLISIYQMVDDGNNVIHISQFEMLFTKLRDESYKNSLLNREKSLASLNAFPLIGSGLLIVMITFGIIEVIGGMVNGI